ncbi:Crp/Fnr family transcriptional regulator [Negadavirga shengliensis]|uniref:Crp/Fnr family transcriptional regulator n=1 Tax=Negadavirga shengliensis TaxID=1389218 RepID=A0ABV9T0H4_9BACT
MFELLHQTIMPHVSLSQGERKILEEAFVFRQVPKKFKLAEEGKVAKELYFINKGLLRLFYSKEGDEITAFIFQEGLFAASYDSFLSENPSIQSLETLEDCELLVVAKEEMEELYRRLPAMNTITRKIAEQRFINAQRLLSSFILETPEERYRKFETDHKDLLQRVPQHYIASFLGITPVSLSRIRKRLQKK